MVSSGGGTCAFCVCLAGVVGMGLNLMALICFGINWVTATVEEAGGVDINTRDENGLTPLHWAAWWNENPAVIEVLLKMGGGVNAQDKDGWTPLLKAAMWNRNLAVVEALLRAGGEVNARAQNGWTPLHGAANCNENPALEHWAGRCTENPKLIKVLVEAGGAVDAQNKDGRTPLHQAAINNQNPAMIKALLKVNANPNIKDNQGKIPVDYIDEDEDNKLRGTSAHWDLKSTRLQ